MGSKIICCENIKINVNNNLPYLICYKNIMYIPFLVWKDKHCLKAMRN